MCRVRPLCNPLPKAGTPPASPCAHGPFAPPRPGAFLLPPAITLLPVPNRGPLHAPQNIILPTLQTRIALHPPEP